MNAQNTKSCLQKKVDFEDESSRHSHDIQQEHGNVSVGQLLPNSAQRGLTQFKGQLDPSQPLNKQTTQDGVKFFTENSPRQEDRLIQANQDCQKDSPVKLSENVVFDSNSSVSSSKKDKTKSSPMRFNNFNQNNKLSQKDIKQGACLKNINQNSENMSMGSSVNSSPSQVQIKSSRNTIDGDLINSQILSVQNDGLYQPSHGDESNMENDHGIKNYDKLGNVIPNKMNLSQNQPKISKKSNPKANSEKDSEKDSQDNESIKVDSDMISSVSDLTALEDQEPGEQLLKYIENFYENNYYLQQVKNIKDYNHKRIWALHFDEIYDQVYIFVAEIDVLQNQTESKKVNPKLPPKMSKSFNEGFRSKVSKKFEDKFRRAITRQKTTAVNINWLLATLSKELDALKSIQNPECICTLKIQIWNLDDRMMSKKGNSKIQPQFETICLKTMEKMSGSYNKFQIMQTLYNKYMDHTQLIQFENKIFFFKDFYNFRIFDIQERSFFSDPVQIFDHSKQKTFKSLFHKKEGGVKSTKTVDKLLIFSYNQYKNNFQSSCQHQKVSPWHQTLSLRFMDYEALLSNAGQVPFVDEIDIDDEKLYQYYTEDASTKKLNNMFVHRIDDSQSYILLFPTGLIYTVGLNPLIIQSKFQLTLKKDENIIDYQYSISEDSKFHCIWILDEKLQVWKCNNECNPNQVVWTLTRAAIFNKLKIPKFFQQATTYDEFYMNDFLADIECYKKRKSNQIQQSDFLVAFNGTATKVMMISQPIVPLLSFSQDEFNGDNILNMISSAFSMPIEQIKDLQISFQIIAQQQTIILNRIRKKREKFTKTQAKQFQGQAITVKDELTAGVQPLENKIQQSLPNQQEDNEILELQYLKRVKLQLSGQKEQKFFQQFLVRRKHCLQIMFTNGLSFWSHDIADSHTAVPYEIQDILLSQDNDTLVDYCSIPGYQQRCFYRVYKYEDYTKSFKLVKEQQVKTSDRGLKLQEMSNIALDNDGKVLYIKIQLMPSINQKKEESNLRQSIQLIRKNDELLLQIPKFVIFKELIKTSGGIPKIMTSDDGRIFMCNRLLIQLEKDLSAIKDIGCIQLQRDHQNIQYKFLSLLDDEPRKKISKLMKMDIQYQIVKFDILNEPLTLLNDNEDDADILYFSNEIQDPQKQQIQGTSIVKMSMENLACIEIYRSNANIVHFTLFDPDDLIQDEEKNEIDQLQNEDQIKTEVEQAKLFAIKQQSRSMIPECPGEAASTQKGGDKAAIDQSKMLAFLAEQLQEQLQDKLQEQAEGGGEETNSSASLTPSSNQANENDRNLGKVLIKNKRNQRAPKVTQGPDENLQESNSKAKIELKFEDIQNSDETDDLKNVLNMMSGPLPGPMSKPLQKKLDINQGHKKSQSVFINTQEEIQKIMLATQKKNIKTIYISLVSQTKTQIKIEVLADMNCKDQFNFTKKDQESITNPSKSIINFMKARLIHCINVSQNKELVYDGEIGWINADQFILTIENEYYICNINGSFMTSIKEGISFGKQQVSINQFVSIVSQQNKSNLMRRATTKRFSQSNFRSFSDHNNELLVKATEVIQRMELASLIRFSFIKKTQEQQGGINQQLLFFLPCEELKGGSIFQKLSFNYNVIQPYIEKIDSEFIKILNYRIRNIANYLNKSIEHGKIVPLKNKIIQSKHNQTDEDKIQQNGSYSQQKIQVHMFQEDITGQNAIDNAFEKNSIFCIKTYVDFLLTLENKDEIQFKNCFDKALLLMINKRMDVKELVQSQILYPSLWANQTVFSHIEDLEIKPYNNTIEELIFEDPYEIFAQDDHEYKASKTQAAANYKIIMKNQIQDEDSDQNQKEQHEMQFHYLDLQVIQGQNVLNLAKSLSDSNDLKLFEMEAVQVIIDYKWNTYGRQWFMLQLVIYVIFLFFFYIDMQSMFYTETRDQKRIKNKMFMMNKIICFSVQAFFMFYEASQFYQSVPRHTYFLSLSNYLPLLSIVFYMSASLTDLVLERPSDFVKIMYVLSTLMSLANVLLLVRVFKQLSFLVIMMRMVVSDLLFFMILFVFFIFTFAACYQIVQVDGSSYGRINNMFAMFVATVRSSFGDFSLIHPWQGFDNFEEDQETGEPLYNNSQTIVTFTYVIFTFQTLTLFMVFMNFIIAVIADSYQTVIEFSEAHDYKQRIEMIEEREMYFTKHQLQNPLYFPKFLVIRKKRNAITERNNIQNQIKSIKDFVREASQQNLSLINEKSKEQKEHQNNSFKKLENDLLGIKSDIGKVLSEFKQLSTVQQEQGQQQAQMVETLSKLKKNLGQINDGRSDFASQKTPDPFNKVTERSKKSINLMSYKSPKSQKFSDYSFVKFERGRSQSPKPVLSPLSQDFKLAFKHRSPQVVNEQEKSIASPKQVNHKITIKKESDLQQERMKYEMKKLSFKFQQSSNENQQLRHYIEANIQNQQPNDEQISYQRVLPTQSHPGQSRIRDLERLNNVRIPISQRSKTPIYSPGRSVLEQQSPKSFNYQQKGSMFNELLILNERSKLQNQKKKNQKYKK